VLGGTGSCLDDSINSFEWFDLWKTALFGAPLMIKAKIIGFLPVYS
jgi:hypothetical protein